MIDPFKPVRFYNKRAKLRHYIMSKMVYLDNHVCLCIATLEGKTLMAIPRVEDYVLFDLENGYVQTENLQFWFAENY